MSAIQVEGRQGGIGKGHDDSGYEEQATVFKHTGTREQTLESLMALLFSRAADLINLLFYHPMREACSKFSSTSHRER